MPKPLPHHVAAEPALRQPVGRERTCPHALGAEDDRQEPARTTQGRQPLAVVTIDDQEMKDQSHGKTLALGCAYRGRESQGRDQSSRPRVTPVAGCDVSETRLSSCPISPPSTSTCAGPRTTSSGVEYMAFTSFLYWRCGGAPPLSWFQPLLAAQPGANLPTPP